MIKKLLGILFFITLFSGLTVTQSWAADPKVWVTEGIYTDKIEVNWTNEFGAITYKLYYSTNNTRPADP